jgi:hypothetical protein
MTLSPSTPCTRNSLSTALIGYDPIMQVQLRDSTCHRSSAHSRAIRRRSAPACPAGFLSRTNRYSAGAAKIRRASHPAGQKTPAKACGESRGYSADAMPGVMAEGAALFRPMRL